MTDMEDIADRSALVPGAHRLIRAVDGSEGPFAGSLVAYEDGVAVCVDAFELAEWGGWASADADHVCGVIDLRRRIDGQDALLPWCTQRIEAFLGRRRAAGAELAAGELATLVASLVRGVRELGDDAADAIGEWWLTGDGRPLFVHGDGGGARARTAGIIERITAHTGDRATRRILDEMVMALRERRHHSEDDARWEEQLFATAAPRALRLDVFAPEKAADLVPRRTVMRHELDEPRNTRRSRRQTRADHRLQPRPVRMMVEALWTALRGRLRMLVSLRRRAEPSDTRSERQAAARQVPGRQGPRRQRRPRRRVLILAGSLAGLVLVVGLMWPEAQEAESANAAQSSEATAPTADATPDATDDADSAPTEQTPIDSSPSREAEPLVAVPALLSMIAECLEAASEVCPEALSGGLAVPQAGAVAQGPDGSMATLVDDYGDVAVIKLVPVDVGTGAVAQMLVLERQDEKWLVRDIYDVAHQPG